MIKRIFPLLITLLWIIIDLVTKKIAVDTLTESRIQVNQFLNWTLAYNPGAAFSFLSDAGGWQRWFFAALAIVISIWLFYMILVEKTSSLIRLGYASILGGAIGNLYDRLKHGHVIDFIQVHYNEHYFPIFNVADMAITIGVIILIFGLFFKKDH